MKRLNVFYAGTLTALMLAACARDNNVTAPDLVGKPPVGVTPSLARIIFVKGVEGRSHLYTMKQDGSNLQQLTNGPFDDDSPAVSPDGSRIAFQRDGDIYVMNADGTGIRRITFEGGIHPTLSPDGTKIALGGAVGKGILVISADGGGSVTRLTHLGVEDSDYSPAWSPDGQQIAFTRTEWNYSGVGNPFTRVWIANADGTGETPMRTMRRFGRDGFGAGWSPVFSPDNNKIAFSGPWPLGAPSMKSTVLVMNRDGSGEVSLTSAPDKHLVSSVDDWSLDGKWVAFTMSRSVSNTSTQRDVFLVATSDGKVVRITADGQSWSAAFLRTGN